MLCLPALHILFFVHVAVTLHELGTRRNYREAPICYYWSTFHRCKFTKQLLKAVYVITIYLSIQSSSKQLLSRKIVWRNNYVSHSEVIQLEASLPILSVVTGGAVETDVLALSCSFIFIAGHT